MKEIGKIIHFWGPGSKQEHNYEEALLTEMEAIVTCNYLSSLRLMITYHRMFLKRTDANALGAWNPAQKALDTRHDVLHSVASDAVIKRNADRFEGNMTETFGDGRKLPGKALLAAEERLLIGRDDAAQMLSISRRALDYLIANRQIATRRIGSRVLIPVAELKRFSRVGHPSRLAG